MILSKLSQDKNERYKRPRPQKSILSPNLIIGTSGWIYGHWDGIFYPKNLKNQDKLKYYSQHFKTVEINYSFYHLPQPKTYQNWYQNTPKDFVFAVKVSRLITHVKKLKGVKKSWHIFFKNTLNLREKLGPFLFQFPPSFPATSNNIQRVENFLKFIRENLPYNSHKIMELRFAFEFRHKSWCDNKIYKILKKYNIAWVIADSPSFPRAEEVTADFIYIRMHGSKMLFSSNYTEKDLENLTQKIQKWQKRNLDAYIYFNNDAQGFAIFNAKRLLELFQNGK